jgi:Tfp pilus assembly protein PilF
MRSLILIALAFLSSTAFSAEIRVQVRLVGSRLEPRGVLIRVQALGGRVSSGGQLMQSTDSSGKTTFAGLENTDYDVSAEFPGFNTKRERVDLTFAQGYFAVFELTPKVDPNAPPAVPPEGPFATLAANIDPKAQEKYQDGQKQLEKNNPSSAISNFKKALEIDPKYTDAYLALGTTYMDTGEFPKAQETLAKVVEMEPKLPGARFALGAAYNRTNAFPQAEEQLRAGLQLNDAVADGHYELANVLLKTGRLPEGETHVRKAIELDKAHKRAYLLLGNVLLAKKDKQGAVDAYREYLKLDPKGPMADATKQMIEKLEKEIKKGS